MSIISVGASKEEYRRVAAGTAVQAPPPPPPAPTESKWKKVGKVALIGAAVVGGGLGVHALATNHGRKRR